jgi:3-phenylpropionate/cinnamic acid dioxygenase small subunit
VAPAFELRRAFAHGSLRRPKIDEKDPGQRRKTMSPDDAVAHESIRQAIASYTIAGDSRDAELFVAQFAEDAIFEFAGFTGAPGFRHQGLDEIRGRTAAWVKLPVDDPELRSASFIRHNLTTCRIERTGPDAAQAKTYFVVFTDIGPDHAGTYTDAFVRRDGRWLIAHRKIALDWRSPDSIYPPVKR